MMTIQSLTDRLPPEILLEVLSYLNMTDIKICAAVSRKWNGLSADDQIWRRFCQRDPLVTKRIQCFCGSKMRFKQLFIRCKAQNPKFPFSFDEKYSMVLMAYSMVRKEEKDYTLKDMIKSIGLAPFLVYGIFDVCNYITEGIRHHFLSTNDTCYCTCCSITLMRLD